MKKVRRLIYSTIALLIILIMCAPSCLADTPRAKATVWLEDGKKNKVDGLQVFACLVAETRDNGYSPAQNFENADFSVSEIAENPSLSNAKKTLKFVNENQVSAVSMTAVEGRVDFDPLDTGIWLIYCKEGAEYSFNPFFIFLPHVKDGELCYEVNSFPKVQDSVENDKSIYVVKIWKDEDNQAKKRPKSIDVDLKLDGKTVKTATIDGANGWTHTFTKLLDDRNYTVEEKAVKDYSVKYSGDSENGFVITNTYSGGKLPQTGQLWWPVIASSVCGVVLILWGIVELGVKKDESK